MPRGIGRFASIQPMTPMIDSLRALTLDLPLGNSLMLALYMVHSIKCCVFCCVNAGHSTVNKHSGKLLAKPCYIVFKVKIAGVISW